MRTLGFLLFYIVFISILNAHADPMVQSVTDQAFRSELWKKSSIDRFILSKMGEFELADTPGGELFQSLVQDTRSLYRLEYRLGLTKKRLHAIQADLPRAESVKQVIKEQEEKLRESVRSHVQLEKKYLEVLDAKEEKAKQKYLPPTVCPDRPLPVEVRLPAVSEVIHLTSERKNLLLMAFRLALINKYDGNSLDDPEQLNRLIKNVLRDDVDFISTMIPYLETFKTPEESKEALDSIINELKEILPRFAVNLRPIPKKISLKNSTDRLPDFEVPDSSLPGAKLDRDGITQQLWNYTEARLLPPSRLKDMVEFGEFNRQEGLSNARTHIQRLKQIHLKTVPEDAEDNGEEPTEGTLQRLEDSIAQQQARLDLEKKTSLNVKIKRMADTLSSEWIKSALDKSFRDLQMDLADRIQDADQAKESQTLIHRPLKNLHPTRTH